MGRGKGWGRWGRAGPHPTQGPGTHLFHFLGKEGTGSEVDQVCPTQLPNPTKGSPKQRHKDRQGAEPAPQL